MCRNACEHPVGSLAHPLGPVLANQVVVATNPTRRHDDSLGPQLKLAHNVT